MSLTGAQIRAARGLVRWSAEELARRAKLGRITVTRAESASGKPNLTKANIEAIRRALEAAGVEFIPENGGGPGVRLRKTAEQGIAPDSAPEPDSEPGQGPSPG
jgi:transcriptional regulator with XRE-family HTH domain